MAPFLKDAARLLNAGQTRVLVLSGSVDDLYASDDQQWLALPELLQETWNVSGRCVVTYEINGPIRFADEHDKRRMRDAWVRWRTGLGPGDLALQRLVRGESSAHQSDAGFDEQLARAIGKPTVALELLRQLCCCARAARDGKWGFREELLIIVEAADLILPESPVASLNDADRHRLHICHDWFADTEFTRSSDAVVLIAESRSTLNQRVMRLPQILDVSIPDPDHAQRLAFIHHFCDENQLSLKDGEDETIAAGCAGLSIHALRQLLLGILHNDGTWDQADLVAKVEQHILAQLGEGTVEFSRPQHRLSDVIGFRQLKGFLDGELIPRLRAGGKGALAGAAICGPIGAGKTFIFEAMAAELELPVLVLKNIRSQWFGQTDVVIERLKRVLTALDRAVIIVDEADTQFGSLGAGGHDTERRLTGKLQAMMSDPKLLGKVFWLLMTARIDQLSPDLRRPGRAGDLIIPVLDPEGDDQRAFLEWIIAGFSDTGLSDEAMEHLVQSTSGWSAASYAALRREIAAQKNLKGSINNEQLRAIIDDRLDAPLGGVRREQTLLALLHCTRKSLLPPGTTQAQRDAWRQELSVSRG